MMVPDYWPWAVRLTLGLAAVGLLAVVGGIGWLIWRLTG